MTTPAISPLHRPGDDAGLTDAEAAARRAAGEGNAVKHSTSRSYAAIARANLFTLFNNILFAIGVALIVLGEINDAMTSVGLGLVNAVISTIQEIRAKRQLDRIALLARPTVALVREGRERPADPDEIVRGDLLRIRSGDQAIVDGVVTEGGPLEFDESLLTGESEPMRKVEGDRILSGSICVSGAGSYRAEVVGEESYANQLTARARAFTLVRTPLQMQIDFSVRVIMLVVTLMSGVILVSALLEHAPTIRIVQLAAVLSGQIPYGLFLVIVVGYSLSAAAIARQGALVQQINAVESLSAADVLCMDKTGTLTANRLVYLGLDAIGGADRAVVEAALGDFARGFGGGNQTSAAIAAALPGSERIPADTIPFSSARKWSALAFAADGSSAGTFALGAFEMLGRHLEDADNEALRAAVKRLAAEGTRVLLFAGNPGVTRLHDGDGNALLPPLKPLALVKIGDELRPRAVEALAAFRTLGLKLKVISGDDPETVAALARQAGFGEEMVLVSGPELAELDEASFARVASEATVFGRILPAQKEQLVKALTGRGHYVAMIGDGVNDVLALKQAQLGIAMRSGSAAARNVADMVLLNDDFAPLEPALREGQRVVTGMTHALALMLSRVASSILTIIAITMLGLAFPFEPAQIALTLFSVGIPTLFMTLWAHPAPRQRDLIPSLVRFVVPVAILTMIAGVALYTYQYNRVLAGLGKYEFRQRAIDAFEHATGLDFTAGDTFSKAAATIVAQSTLSVFITFTAFLLILFLAPPIRLFTGWQSEVTRDRRPLYLTLGLTLVFIAVITQPPLADYFGLIAIGPGIYLSLAVMLLLWTVALRSAWRYRWLDRFLGLDGDQAVRG